MSHQKKTISSLLSQAFEADQAGRFEAANALRRQAASIQTELDNKKTLSRRWKEAVTV